jgi:hypothetical protein
MEVITLPPSFLIGTKITQREFSNYYVRFLNLRHLGNLLVCVSSPLLNNYSFSPYHLNASMWSSWIGKKNTTHIMCIAKLSDGFERDKKLFKAIWKKGFDSAMMEE